MTIKLDWDVTEAPHDDEVFPRSPDNTRGPRDQNPKDEPAGRLQRLKRLAGGQRRRLWPLIGLALLVALAGGGAWYFTQAGWQRVSGDVVAAVKYEEQEATAGSTDLLLNVQDRGNVDWLSIRRDESLARQPAPLPIPTLNFGQGTLKVADVTALDADFILASVNRQFTTPDGRTLTFTLPQFYRRAANNDWLRSAPPGSFWGNWQDWQGTRLVVRYSERDANLVSQIAPLLDKRLADACSVWPGGCPSQAPVRLYLSGFAGSLEYNPTSNVEVRVKLGTPSGSALTPADYFLSIASPQLAGAPADDASRAYLADYLTVRLIASLAHHISPSPGGYYQRTSQAIQALGLTAADPGYLSTGRQQRNTPNANDIAGLGAQANNGSARGQDRFAWRVISYTTVAGDTLPSIAAHFGTSVVAIVRANRLGNRDSLPAGVKLTIPLFTGGTAAQ